MATSGENYWPPTGRTSWPLTWGNAQNEDQIGDDVQTRLPEQADKIQGHQQG